MKSFIASIIIIVMVIVLISVNAFFTEKTADSLLLSLESLEKAKTTESYEDFKKEWDAKKTYYSLTVSRKSLQNVEEGLLLISFSLTEQKPSDFARGISDTKRAIMEIKDFSSFIFTNIL